MRTEEQPIQMTHAEKEAARAVLAVAQGFVDKGDLRGYARALEEAAGLAKAAVLERK
ncbi:hypothetical protein AB4Y36_22130 [Paraburkholderia sp. BR10936]|uniref:hypothetical protein n=1 Tax=Paraburkholderia sp. BR10936 TaxID=3236993 RepID=UPI0034D33671